MPYSTIKTFLMIGATVAAIGATTPLAQAQTDQDIVDRAMHRGFECVQGKRSWDEEPCPDVAALLQWSNRPMHGQAEQEAREAAERERASRPETDAEYFARTGFHYGPRTGANAIAQCAPPHHMTRDGCQR
jgi:hypothetical protein